ncbi:MAG: hypothetical protein K0Q59_3782, partial [Paenibacillus sp.]|nr:hypothetical protein [Paenibacillus sp.]
MRSIAKWRIELFQDCGGVTGSMKKRNGECHCVVDKTYGQGDAASAYLTNTGLIAAQHGQLFLDSG